MGFTTQPVGGGYTSSVIGVGPSVGGGSDLIMTTPEANLRQLQLALAPESVGEVQAEMEQPPSGGWEAFWLVFFTNPVAALAMLAQGPGSYTSSGRKISGTTTEDEAKALASQNLTDQTKQLILDEKLTLTDLVTIQKSYGWIKQAQLYGGWALTCTGGLGLVLAATGHAGVKAGIFGGLAVTAGALNLWDSYSRKDGPTRLQLSLYKAFGWITRAWHRVTSWFKSIWPW